MKQNRSSRQQNEKGEQKSIPNLIKVGSEMSFLFVSSATLFFRAALDDTKWNLKVGQKGSEAREAAKRNEKKKQFKWEKREFDWQTADEGHIADYFSLLCNFSPMLSGEEKLWLLASANWRNDWNFFLLCVWSPTRTSCPDAEAFFLIAALIWLSWTN